MVPPRLRAAPRRLHRRGGHVRPVHPPERRARHADHGKHLVPVDQGVDRLLLRRLHHVAVALIPELDKQQPVNHAERNTVPRESALQNRKQVLQDARAVPVLAHEGLQLGRVHELPVTNDEVVRGDVARQPNAAAGAQLIIQVGVLHPGRKHGRVRGVI